MKICDMCGEKLDTPKFFCVDSVVISFSAIDCSSSEEIDLCEQCLSSLLLRAIRRRVVGEEQSQINALLTTLDNELKGGKDEKL